MINVDVIFSSKLNSIIGPVQTLKRLVSNHPFFLENGYNLTLFTLDNPGGAQSLSYCQTSSVAKRNQSFLAKKIKEIARFLALHSYLYDAIRIKKLLSAPTGLIQQYCSMDREQQVIVFHYIYDCYCYLKQVKDVKAKIVLFIHADSTKSSMLLEYFPKAKGTAVERELDNITQFVLEKVDRVISISKIGAKNFLKEHPELEGRVEVVVNGIDDITTDQLQYVEETRKNPSTKKYRLISCGTINGRKGQWIVIDALSKLPKNLLDEIEYTIVGDGPQRVSLEATVARYGLKNVRFVGSVPNVEVYKHLAEANIAILMSSNEGLPLSLIEALRCGLAGISTRVAGIPEVMVDGHNGILIERSVEALSEILLHISDYDWETMGQKSRKLFEDEYTFNRMKNDYLKMLQNL